MQAAETQDQGQQAQEMLHEGMPHDGQQASKCGCSGGRWWQTHAVQQLVVSAMEQVLNCCVRPARRVWPTQESPACVNAVHGLFMTWLQTPAEH